jgi:hypothetical protein
VQTERDDYLGFLNVNTRHAKTRRQASLLGDIAKLNLKWRKAADNAPGDSVQGQTKFLILDKCCYRLEKLLRKYQGLTTKKELLKV